MTDHDDSKTKPRIRITNPFDSPSLIKTTKDVADLNNPYDSPGIQSNMYGNIADRSVDPSKSPSCEILTRAGTETVNPLLSPSVIYLGLNEIASRNAMSSPSLLTTSEARTRSDLPITLITGQRTIKQALIMLAVNPRIGGLSIIGSRGCAKSVLARALHRLMPPIQIIKDSLYNIDPHARDNEIDSILKSKLENDNILLSDLPVENITCPFVQVPVNVLEDRLFGALDVKRTLERGEAVFTPGLLASSHRGILYVDDINLIDPDIVAALLQAVSDGFVCVEREGISVRYPCQPLLVATYNPDDAEFKAVFQDRIGMCLSPDAEPLSTEQRVIATLHVISFQDKTMSPIDLETAYADENRIREAIAAARINLPHVTINRQQLLYICEEASRGQCEGHNGEIVAARVAMASAALRNATTVRSDDLRLAVQVAVVPRSRYMEAQEEPPMESVQTTSLQSQRSASSSSMEKDKKKQETEEEKRDQDQDENTQEQEQEQAQTEEGEDEEEPTATVTEEEEDEVPANFVFEISGIPIKSSLTSFIGKQLSGVGRRSGRVYSRDRGRYVRAVIPKKGETVRVAVDATLREAAKHQVWRRREASERGEDPSRVYLEPEDLRAKLMARKAGSLLIFVVDSSGSMALNRMNAAKGAACSLLSQAYQNRDKIALINFHGMAAEVLLPPTRSVALARRRLEVMPCGGGTPMAHGLTLAVRTGLSAVIAGNAGRCIIVVITDGRANIPLSTSLRIESQLDMEAETEGVGVGMVGQTMSKEDFDAVNSVRTLDSSASAVEDNDRDRDIDRGKTSDKSDNGVGGGESVSIPAVSASPSPSPLSSISSSSSSSFSYTPSSQLSAEERRELKVLLKEEILGLGRQIAFYPKLKLLVIDTENKLLGSGLGRDLAKAAKGKYYYVPKPSSTAMQQIASEAAQSLRTGI